MELHTLGNRYRRIMITLITAVMAVLLVVVGVLMMSNKKDNYVETTATISEIKYIAPDEELAHEVYVDYTIDGHRYEHVQLNIFEFSYSVGKEITILYDPANPSVIKGKKSVDIVILLFAGAAVCAVIAVVNIVNMIRSIKKKKEIGSAPVITESGRTIGEPTKMFFAWDTKTHVKLRFYLEDENRALLYEGKMTKMNPVGANTYVFTDHVRQTETEHKVGHVSSAGSEYTTVSEGFTFDGVEMTEYLDANKIHIQYGKGQGVSISYDIYLGDNLTARAQTTSRYMHEDEQEAHPVASKFQLNQYFYSIEGQRDYADVIFLALFKEALSPRLSSMMG
ncbi:MAG: DUF3592 domain-containing protein [Clostridiales bacterium]|nr:DUF3592 domain-containing protein [Clostridiales bacterium]